MPPKTKTFLELFREMADYNNQFYKNVHNRLGFLISIYSRAIPLYARILKNTSDYDLKRSVKNLTGYFDGLKERFVFLGNFMEQHPANPNQPFDSRVFTAIVDCALWSNNLRSALLSFVSRSRKA